MADETIHNSDSPRAPTAKTELYAPDTGAGGATDVKLANDSTGAAPSFRPPAPPAAVRTASNRHARPAALPPGATIDDFEILRLLGRGAFGHVYLARQMSLDREVALKISANRGSEGRTMARLEQPHIVQVYSEKVDEATNQRLLCMQLVPGVGLEKIIGALGMQLSVQQGSGGADITADWRGSDVLAIIDINTTMPTALDPAALRDREALGAMDSVETTAWMGARLAEALDFAHQRGVLHRDIKPANILVSPYGRPLLADFNISSQSLAAEGDEMFGGTIAYMAPEHLDAFNPAEATSESAVTAQADLYSLGLVLDELLHGRVPRIAFAPNLPLTERLRQLAERRRKEPPHAAEVVPSSRKVLEQSICRCQAPQPAERYPNGSMLAEQLEGCRQMRHAERALPRAAGIVSRMMAKPFFWFVLLVLLPQLAASVINITYNTSQIVGELTPAQQVLFKQLVLVYNAAMYPIALLLFAWAYIPVRRTWHEMHRNQPLAAGQVAAARRQALRLPLWVVGLTAAGWLPGAVLFPAVISLRTGLLDFRIWMHFLASFTLSGLIALAYSLCGSQFVIQRALYPRMWDDVRGFTAIARRELSPMATRIFWIQLLAGSAFAAAVLVLAFSEMSAMFRALVAGLIILGWAGYELTTHVAMNLAKIVHALTAAKS